MDAPSGTHSLPAYVGIPYREITTTHKIQTINLDASDHTVYAGLQTIVNSSDGNDVIHGAGYAYGGAGNDTLAGGGILRGGEGDDFLRDGAWMAGGAGNDILIGGETMVAGAGHDEIYAGVGHATIEVDPTVVTNGLLGGAGDSAYFLDQYYRAQGIDNWEERRDYPGFYHLRHSDIGYGYGSREDLVREFGDLAVGGWTSFEQGLAEGWIRYLAPLPLAPLTRANDFRALEPYYEQGVLQHHAVSFGEGVSPSELQLTWGEVTGVISGTEEQLPLKYTTLNIAWGSVNQYVQVMVPHSDDPLGAGVSQFIFADGATLTMADMVAKAPPAPSFDPQIFNYQVGMGMVAVSSGYDQINFGQGISPTEITLGVGSLLLRIGDSGDVIHIDNFDPSDAMAANTIRHFNFSDGTSLSYAQLLSRGFDIYGTDANEVLTGTNLVNRIYGVGGGDTLIGSGANDTLVSGAGSDTLIGGAGHETFIVNDASDVVIARPDAASNTILSSVDYALPDNVQNLTLTGTANLTAIGNALDNVLTSNSGVNTLIGGTGNVTFVVNNSADIILANPNAASNKVLASVDYELSEGLKTLALIGNGNVTAKGNSLDNILSGNAGHYTLMAGEGNDTLIAGTGDGTLIAGDGVTTFVFNADAGHQTIIESNAVARDIMRFGEGITSSDLVFEQQGSDMRVTFSDRGSVLVRRYDLFTTDTPPYFGEWQFSDGSSISIASGSNFDEPGSFGVSKFNADGNLVAEQWAYAGGEHGRRIYGSYGSVSATHYRADGGRTIYEDDGQGNTIESEFSAGGGLLNDIWSHADGSYGSGIYAADGSSAQINHYANGGRSETTNDGYGDVMMIRYDRNGGKIASQWTKPDGSYGSDTFNPDGSGNGTANYPDGSYETYTNDDHGNVTTQFFDSDNNLLNYVVVNDDGHGNVHTSTFDAAGNLISDSWVHANSAPATTLIAAETAQQGTLYAFHIPDGSFVDPDAGDVLSYSAQLADGSTLPSWLVFDAQTQTFHGTPQNADVGAVSVAVTATDLAGESVTAIFEINVANSNDAPVVLLTLAPQAAVEQQPFAYTLPAGIFADIDVGDSLIYTLTQADGSALPAWLTFDVTTMILSGTPGVDAVGVLDLRLIAADTTGATAFQDLHIGVQALPVLQGTAGNDSLSAAPAGTLLMGMDGDDTLYGHVGGDKLYGGAGIDNLYGWNGNDILEGGDGNDLLVGDAGDDSLDGGLGDDHLFGEQGDDVLHGQEGSDYLEGNDGSDMLYGGAEIDNLVGGAGADTLDGGLGADNMVGGVGDDDYYMDNVRDWAEEGAVQGTDTVFSTVTWTLAENFENLTLAGDAAINGSGNGLANTLVGNSAVNALAGGGGADILDGRAGNDTLTGGTGSDSYLLGRGYGADTVMENDITIGDTDVAQFLMGIEASQIWFRQVGSSLEAGIIGTTDTLTIQNWYVASEYHVEQFKTADGKTLLDGQVQNLVQAMAAFTPPAAGQTTLPESYAASLTPVISANWQ
jgi:Ca2+-binding RTX toxin-like protein